jgi:hypothetical protein
MGSAGRLFSAVTSVADSGQIRELADMRTWLTIFGLAVAVVGQGCKKNEGGSGDGIIYSRGAGADSTNAIIASDGRLSRKDNTNGNYKGTGTNGVPYSRND